MTLPRNIALIAPSMGCGKSTVADYLNARYGYDIVPFAKPMKLMVAELLREVYGMPPREVDWLLTEGKDKMQIHQIPGSPTTRHLLQTLGTEWGRACIHPDFWVRSWQEMTIPIKRVVADDCRFPNEYEAAKERANSQIWRITRPSATITAAHASEGQLDNVPVDAEIVNDGTLQDLFRKVDDILCPVAPIS